MELYPLSFRPIIKDKIWGGHRLNTLLGKDFGLLSNGGESWAELRYQLDKVDFDGKDAVINIIDDEPSYDEREKMIKSYRNGGTYRYMRDRLKKILRNLGCITIYYENK